MATQLATTPGVLRFGDDFELDVRAYELRSGGIPLKLKPIPLELLIFLLERRGELVMREQIVERIWGRGVFLDTDNGINGAISKIRQVLRDDAAQPRFVQTVTGRGYRFIAAVAESPAPPLPAVEASPAPVEGLIGKKVTHYRILALLGGGGMGVVYKAEDLKLGRRVAIKFLPSELASDPKALARLESEARAASALDHRNICSIYELDEHEGQPFIVMQLLEGQTLQEEMESTQGTPLPLTKVLSIAVQVAEGLRAAHEKGFIHRDIKPANIFVTMSNEAKILDFGLAKGIEDEVGERDESEASEANRAVNMRSADSLRLTLTGLHMGTAFYMSPEQVRGEKLDARTDIFSFGLVLYQMLSGQRAFPGKSTAVVHDGILHQDPVPIRQINPEAPEELATIVKHAIEKDPDLRYQSAAAIAADLKLLQTRLAGTLEGTAATTNSVAARSRRTHRSTFWAVWIPTLLVLFAVLVIYIVRHPPVKAGKLAEKDTIVVADFNNSTGDRVFDDTLRQGLSAQLEQSPFLNLLTDQRISETLALMTQPKDARLTHQMATEVCERTGSAATVEGSVAALGSQYVLNLKAVNCHTGDLLADEQRTANSKEQVLNVLADAATHLRQKLGESLSSLQKFDAPPDEVTTSSIEALNAFTLGKKAVRTTGDFAAIPFFLRAVQLDPNFAEAYVALGSSYSNTREQDRATANMEKAFALRDRVSARERFHITALYHQLNTVDLPKAEEACQLWTQSYPRDPLPLEWLGNISLWRGDYVQGLEFLRAAEQRRENNIPYYFNQVEAYFSLNRTKEARATVKKALDSNLEPADYYPLLYFIDFLDGNTAGMQADAAWAAGKTNVEIELLNEQSDTEAYYGRRREAWELSLKAVRAVRRDNESERPAIAMGNAAVREAEFGNSARALQAADWAMSLAPTRDIKILAALAFARAGFIKRAQAMADEVARENPSNTPLNYYWLPTIRAAIELNLNHPLQAVELLQVSTSYELGSVPLLPQATMYPAFVRGEAYLRLKDGAKAAREFQKLIDHPGCVLNYPLGALAHLGLGRAYALAGETTKARSAYRDFFALWKDADPDIAILRQAKAEYVSLKRN